MATQSPIKLSFFMSRATSLQRWADLGLYGREIEIYRRLAARLTQLQIFTSGDANEGRYGNSGEAAERIEAEILFNPRRLSPNLYSLWGVWLHRERLRTADLYKTNQIDGAWSALLASRLYRKPVIVRAGYLWALDMARQESAAPLKLALVRALDRFAYRQADHIILTTTAMQQYVVEEYGVPLEKVTVIPNYVDTARFRPDPEIPKKRGLISFVGRLRPVKNVDLLIRAVSQLPGATLRLIGEGENRAEYEQLARDLDASVDFMGAQPNHKLPALIAESEIFILPSRFEGHPKALLEAMACQMPVIGTAVDGIQTVIRDGETGLLVEPTADAIRAGLARLLDDEALRHRLAAAAFDFALEKYSLDKIVETELALYEMVIEGTRLTA